MSLQLILFKGDKPYATTHELEMNFMKNMKLQQCVLKSMTYDVTSKQTQLYL